jgi:prepilin-type N-terminal cleavage/methylation domain-containing protein
MSGSLKQQKGFTLIEIVIVLAIAALILAGVLLAVTGAQRSRRDTQRRDDAGRVASYLEQSASNFNGNYPGTAGGDTAALFNTKYVAGNNLRDPSNGNNYAITFVDGDTTCPAALAAGLMQVHTQGRQYAVCAGMESTDVYRTAN